MPTASIIDGKKIAAEVRAGVAKDAQAFEREHGIKPGLAVVLVGEDPASQVYVRNKIAQTKEAGMTSIEHRLPVETREEDLLNLVAALNADSTVHGILVQLPLPDHVDAEKVLNTIDPDKDVDGFHPMNVGRLSIGEPALAPCTPTGVIILAKSIKPDLTGMEAVIIGRSNIVGKPMAQLLLAENCTVTVAHSRTRDLPGVVARADLVVAAVGRAEMVKKDWVKPGAIVIDVGMNRVPRPDSKKSRLTGDVAFEEVSEVASAVTPVPGGVGPMTVACLLRNTLAAAHMQLSKAR